MKGLDFAYERPDPSWLAANYDFVMRYLSWKPNRKVIDKAEYDSYIARGLRVGLNWEWIETDMRRGHAGGTIDAKEALRQAIDLGAWPCVIWFSCDYDAPEFDFPLINAYMNACAEVLGRGNEGIYGGYWTVKQAMQAGAVSHGWQTFAWSHAVDGTRNGYTLWYPGAQLRQVATRDGAAVGYTPTGTDVDLNEGELPYTVHEEDEMKGLIVISSTGEQYGIMPTGHKFGIDSQDALNKLRGSLQFVEIGEVSDNQLAQWPDLK